MATMLPRLDRLMAGGDLIRDRRCYFPNRGYRPRRILLVPPLYTSCFAETHKSRLQLCSAARRTIRGTGEGQARPCAERRPRHRNGSPEQRGHFSRWWMCRKAWDGHRHSSEQSFKLTSYPTKATNARRPLKALGENHAGEILASNSPVSPFLVADCCGRASINPRSSFGYHPTKPRSDRIRSDHLFPCASPGCGNCHAECSSEQRGYSAILVISCDGFWVWSLSACSWIYYKLVLGRDRPSSVRPAVPLALHIVFMIAAVASRPHLKLSPHRRHRAILNFLLLLFFWVFAYAFLWVPHSYTDWSVAFALRGQVIYLVENFLLLVVLGL